MGEASVSWTPAERDQILAKVQAQIDRKAKWHGKLTRTVPSRPPFRKAPDSLQFVFNQERHDVGQACGGFFATRKTGYTFAFDEKPGLIPYAMEDRRRMTDSTHRLAGVVERLDRRDGVGIIDDIPHGTVVDTRVVTGQNPASSTMAAKALMETVAARKAA